MSPETLHAARMVFAYGNVGRNVEELLSAKPTEAELQEARFKMILAVEQSISLMRAHHGLPQPGAAVTPYDEYRTRQAIERLSEVFKDRLQQFVGQPCTEELRQKMHDELVGLVERLPAVVAVVDREPLDKDMVRLTITLDPAKVRWSPTNADPDVPAAGRVQETRGDHPRCPLG